MQPYQSRFLRCGGLALAALCLLGATLGCGNARRATGTSAAGGSAVIAITWPDAGGTESREIPTETKRFVIRVVGETELSHLRKEIVRSSGVTSQNVAIEGLPYAPLLFLVEAYGDATQTPIALGGRTVEIQKDVRASIDITLVATGGKAGELTSKGSAVVLVRDVPPGAASVSLRVLQNGQVIPGEGEPPSINITATTTFSTVPFSLPSLPAGSLLFQATAYNAAGTTVAQGSRSAAVDALTESTVTVALTLTQPSDGTDTGGTGGTQPTLTGTAVISVTNIAQGDALLVVDPMPGDPSLLGTAADRGPISVPLRGSFVSDNLPVTRVPVLVSGLQTGPWLFVVTTHTGLNTTDPVNRVGTVQGNVQASARLDLDAPLGNAQTAAPPKLNGEVNVLTTNITAEGTRIILVAAFDSAGRVADVVVPVTSGVNERLVTFSLAGGPYTAVSAAYGGPAFDRVAFDTALAADKATIPAGALAVGSKTVTITSSATTDATVELRLQGMDGAGSVNLAMLNVPVSMVPKAVGGVLIYEIVSSVVVTVYSVRDNQELPTLRQVMVPPSSMTSDGTLVQPGAPYDNLRPLRLRIDGIPIGPMRFEVTAMSAGGGGGSVMGRGSVIADVVTGVQPVTVTVLPHGDLPAGTVLPGISNDASDQNPAPRSRVALDAARRFWATLRRR